MLTKHVYNIMQERFITFSNSPLVDHQLLTELISFCCSKPLKICSFTGKNQLFWLVFTWLETNLGDLELIPGFDVGVRDFAIVEVFAPFLQLSLESGLNEVFFMFFVIILGVATVCRLQEVCGLVVLDFAQDWLNKFVKVGERLKLFLTCLDLFGSFCADYADLCKLREIPWLQLKPLELWQEFLKLP